MIKKLPTNILAAIFFIFAGSSTAHALSFLPGEIEKTNWEARQLTAFDVNADGLTDLAVINGVERSIDLLIQKKKPSMEASKPNEETPPMVLSRFTRERIFTEASPTAFVFGDFSNKGKVEVAYTSKRLGIVFMARNDAGRWVETHRISDVDVLPYPNVMWAGKLAKDQPISLVVLVKGRVLVIRDYKVVASYGTLYEDCGYLTMNDIKGDGRMDMIYDYDGTHGFAVRMQDAQGRFDSETILNYATESEKDFGFRGDRFYFFGGDTPFVEERKLTTTPLKPAMSFYGTFSDRTQAVIWQINGQPALVLADGKGAEMLVYRQNEGVWGSPERFPSLKSVSTQVVIGDAKDTAHSGLALFSPDEHAIGIAHWDNESKRVAFPKLVELSEEPLSLFGLDGKAWVITRSDHDFFLQSLSADGSVGDRKKLDGLKRAPDFAVALNEKGSILFGLFQAHDAASFYLLSAKGDLTTLKTPSAIARSNFSNIEESRIGRGRLTDADHDDLLITQHSTIRIFRFIDGELTLTDQALPINTDANFHLPFVQKNALWAYDTKSNSWFKFERDASARLWKNSLQLEASTVDPQSVIPMGDSGWIGIGRRAFYELSPDVPGLTLTPVRRWESSLKVEGYNWASLESFDKKTPAAVLFAQKEKILEIATLGETPKSAMNFQVYELDPHFEGRKGEDVEPREIIAADVTGDGKPDLILLVHKKIIVYPQK